MSYGASKRIQKELQDIPTEVGMDDIAIGSSQFNLLLELECLTYDVNCELSNQKSKKEKDLITSIRSSSVFCIRGGWCSFAKKHVIHIMILLISMLGIPKISFHLLSAAASCISSSLHKNRTCTLIEPTSNKNAN